MNMSQDPASGYRIYAVLCQKDLRLEDKGKDLWSEDRDRDL